MNRNNIIYKNQYFNVTVQNNILNVQNILQGSAILPLTTKNQVILLNIYRPAINTYSLEIPRGFANDINELPSEVAIREMYEEISCFSKDVLPLGYMHTDTGLTNGKIHLFLGLDTIIKEQKVQTQENIKNIEIIDYVKAYQMAIDGEINDSFTLATILRSNKIIKTILNF